MTVISVNQSITWNHLAVWCCIDNTDCTAWSVLFFLSILRLALSCGMRRAMWCMCICDAMCAVVRHVTCVRVLWGSENRSYMWIKLSIRVQRDCLPICPLTLTYQRVHLVQQSTERTALVGESQKLPQRIMISDPSGEVSDVVWQKITRETNTAKMNAWTEMVQTTSVCAFYAHLRLCKCKCLLCALHWRYWRF